MKIDYEKLAKNYIQKQKINFICKVRKIDTNDLTLILEANGIKDNESDYELKLIIQSPKILTFLKDKKSSLEQARLSKELKRKTLILDQFIAFDKLTYIDFYLLFPEFKKCVEAYRKYNNINPNQNLKALEKIVPKDRIILAKTYLDDPKEYDFHVSVYAELHERTIKNEQKRAEIINKRELRTKELKSNAKKIQNFEKDLPPFPIKYFDSMITNKLTQRWIIDYVLYGIKRGPVLSILSSKRKKPPEIVSGIDSDNQLYFAIKIYDDTDLNWLRKKSSIKLLQKIQKKVFPRTVDDLKKLTRINYENPKEITLLRQALLFKFHNQKKPLDEINEELEEMGFAPIDKKHLGVELKRFEDRFVKH